MIASGVPYVTWVTCGCPAATTEEGSNSMALFKRILGGERKNHRWVSGHLELGQRKEREREIAEQIAKFKQRMDREGVVFREDRDAWEAYWQQYPRAHMDLV